MVLSDSTRAKGVPDDDPANHIFWATQAPHNQSVKIRSEYQVSSGIVNYEYDVHSAAGIWSFRAVVILQESYENLSESRAFFSGIDSRILPVPIIA